MHETADNAEHMALGSRDGRGAGDHDSPHTWGNWRAPLSTVQQGWLTIMRGYVMDHRAGVRGLAADGDIAPTP